MVFKILNELFFFGLVVSEVSAEAAQVGKGVHKLVSNRFEVVVVWKVVVLFCGNLDPLLGGFVDPAARSNIWHLDRPDFLYFDRLAKHLDTCKM